MARIRRGVLVTRGLADIVTDGACVGGGCGGGLAGVAMILFAVARPRGIPRGGSRDKFVAVSGRAAMHEEKIQGLRDRSKMLREAAATLGARIVDDRTRGYLMIPLNHALDDVDTIALPGAGKATNPRAWLDVAEFNLREAEARLKHAEGLVSNYGTTLQLWG